MVYLSSELQALELSLESHDFDAVFESLSYGNTLHIYEQFLRLKLAIV